MSPLNKFCERETHTSKSPFHLARSVPAHSVKTVFDVWNGYHSVPIRDEDRHLTTFTTPWGLFRYKRAPQGFLSSGDGFNRRLDDITAHIVRMERCVDDSLLHDNDLEEHWWRTIDFLELLGSAGIVLNPEKLQFAQSTVDFAGFRITNGTVEPLPKYIDAIKEFPTPENLTDIRSWFGLVNQVSHYAQLREMMEAFRKFLSPKVKFEWTDELDAVFEESKTRIIQAIREGVRIFDTTRRTCLRTDWSKNGIGYFLAQQHCDCKERSHGCCPDGWKITLAGSRFLTSTESNYSPIEGEALAVAWSLEQTRFFTMGCNDLLVIVDHKPLTKMLGDRRLDEIDNPRLFRLKRRTLMWRFDIEYKPGKQNLVADATSRHPSKYTESASIMMQTEEDRMEESIVAGVSNDVEKLFAVTWEKVKAESKCDKTSISLVNRISNGFPNTKKEMSDEIANYWEFKGHLTSTDGVVLYKDRIVIPVALRGRIIENLHSAHQGVSGMLSRAQTIVFWPGITVDIEDARKNCRVCHRNAPSQAKMPAKEPKIPNVPFEMIVADFCQLQGKQYLVIGDRLSGWTEVVRVKPGSTTSGAKGLCDALRHAFVTFGVPEELSSDGGPEFTAQESADFFKRWGIRHRLSSAYFPQSNGRAELAVKMAKSLLEYNTGSDGNLNTDRVVRALLQQRNTPDRDCQLSPAEVLFGRPLRDTMPQLDKSVMIFESGQIHNQWHQAWAAKEEAIRSRLVRSCENLNEHSKELEPLREGDSVFVQNQDPTSSKPNKWDRQGTVIAAQGYDQYLIRIMGSGRLTLRNRRFLRKFQARTPFAPEPPMSDAHLSSPTPTMQKRPVTPAAPPMTLSPTALMGLPMRATPPRSPTQAATLRSPTQGALPRSLTPVAGMGSQMQDTLPRSPTPVATMRSPMRDTMSGSPTSSTLMRSSTSERSPTTGPPSTSTPAPSSAMQAEYTRDSVLRRSTRSRKQRETYDAATGKSALPKGVDIEA